MPFRGRRALVTGAASGMGQLATWRLAAAGVEVAALDVDADGLARTAHHVPQVQTYLCDVGDAEAVHAAVADIAGSGPIDRVVNAAAIAPAGRLVEQPLEEIERAFAVNVVGSIAVTKAILPAMLERGRGDVVLFGSLAGWVPSQRLGAYSATKAAVVSFAETLFHEHRHQGVRIVCVCPPPVDTPMLAQMGDRGPKGLAAVPAIRPEEVLDAVEVALDRGQPFAFPGRGTAATWRVRRFWPSLLWRRIDAMEAG